VMPDSNATIVELSNRLVELTGELKRLADSIEVVKEQQDTMAENIAKVKEAVYNPDQGIYARLRELESWKESSGKLIWLIITSIVGLSTAYIWSQLVSGG